MAERQKRQKRARAPRIAPGDGRSHCRRESPVAVSCGEAARHCLVTADTISKWIAAGHLPAQRTRGGEYRIRVEDLRDFMVAHGMRMDLLDEELGLFPTCWEFWASLDRTARTPAHGPNCDQCPVHRSRASVCHEVRPLLPGGTVRAPSCSDCIYFATVRGIERHEL